MISSNSIIMIVLGGICVYYYYKYAQVTSYSEHLRNRLNEEIDKNKELKK